MAASVAMMAMVASMSTIVNPAFPGARPLLCISMLPMA
jgi:hypothetical protein